MSKILKNTTVSAIAISDTGISIPASPGQYVIPAQDYHLWAASSDVIAPVGAGDLLVNDGSSDLSPSDGMDLIKGIFPNPIGILGATDQTEIGNVGDALKVSASIEGDTLVSDANRLAELRCIRFIMRDVLLTLRQLVKHAETVTDENFPK